MTDGAQEYPWAVEWPVIALIEFSSSENQSSRERCSSDWHVVAEVE